MCSGCLLSQSAKPSVLPCHCIRILWVVNEEIPNVNEHKQRGKFMISHNQTLRQARDTASELSLCCLVALQMCFPVITLPASRLVTTLSAFYSPAARTAGEPMGTPRAPMSSCLWTCWAWCLQCPPSSLLDSFPLELLALANHHLA